MHSFTLPPLPYGYNDLGEWIDGQTMEIHHTKHHQAYVNKLNQALTTYQAPYPEALATFCSEVDNQTPMGIRNNLGGHYNHTLFWQIVTPSGRQSLSPALRSAIEANFGTLEACQSAFTQQALGHFGSGWAWLAVDSQGALFLSSTANQDNPLMKVTGIDQQGTPILGLDVWEHAYYLTYQNRRPDYVNGFWEVVNWQVVSDHYSEAIQR